MQPYRHKDLMPLAFAAILIARAGDLQGAETAHSPEQYLCVADKSTGFGYNNRSKEWGVRSFVTDKKYLISPTSSPTKRFLITQVGEKTPTGFCEDGFNDAGFLLCTMIAGEFKFNRNTGRFLLSYLYGYFTVGLEAPPTTDENSDTPYLEIGKCSPF